MKAIIYAGIGLFAAASVYGVADYYSSQKKGMLDKLYKEEDITPVGKKSDPSTIALPANNVLPAAGLNKQTATVKTTRKLKAAKRTIRLEDFSRGKIVEEVQPVIEVPVEAIKAAAPVKNEEKAPVEKEITTDMIKPVVSNKEPERRISLDMFSRAPLRRPSKMVAVKIQEPKTTAKMEQQ
jgi:hypothetical protein